MSFVAVIFLEMIAPFQIVDVHHNSKPTELATTLIYSTARSTMLVCKKKTETVREPKCNSRSPHSQMEWNLDWETASECVEQYKIIFDFYPCRV